MSAENISTVNILKICLNNRDELLNRINLLEDEHKVTELKIKKLGLERDNEFKKIKKEKLSLDQAIETLTKANSVVPPDIKQRADNLLSKINSHDNDYQLSQEVVDLNKKLQTYKKEINILNEQKISCERKIDIATKLNASVKVMRSKENFYNAWSEIFHTSKTTLGQGASNILSFESIDELIEEYSSRVPIIVSINDNYICENVTVFGICENFKPLLPVDFAKIIPKELNWIASSGSPNYENLPVETAKGIPVYAGDGIYFVFGETNPSPAKKEYEDAVNSFSRKYANTSLNFNEINLFYIRSLNKFYAVDPRKIFDVQLIEKSYWSADRRSHREVVVDEDARTFFDGSDLFDDFNKVLKESKFYNDLLVKRFNQMSERLFSKEEFIGKLDNRLTEIEIKQEVGMYWDAFVNSPWDMKIPTNGPLRMLKHLCMRKHEVPDICSTNYKGCYRFNLRTRDHTWIVGRLFCPSASLHRKTPIKPDEVLYYRSLVQVGDAFIEIEGEI